VHCGFQVSGGYSGLLAEINNILERVCTDVGLDKVGPSGEVAAGALMNYSVTISNTGGFTTKAPPSFNDQLPPGTSYVSRGMGRGLHLVANSCLLRFVLL
jgi:uncharacterized repeat protein (TIGR01451 family)